MKMNYLKMTAIAFMGAVVISSCSKEEIVEKEASLDPQESRMEEKYFMGDKVKVRKEEDGTYSLQGSDIRLFEDQLTDYPIVMEENPTPGVSSNERTQLSIEGFVRKWTNNTIVYEISGLSQSVRSELQKSFDEWTSKTSIRFKQRTNESNYITISSNGDNCNCGVATLGMRRPGFIRLGTRTTAVVIIHEIGHTLGFPHEQNRPDRDDHVIINYENIQDDAIDQFQKSSSIQPLTREFDLGSTMMYGSYTFSKNGRPTITDLQGNTYPRRRAALSQLDIEGTNQAYPGEGTTPTPTDPCDGVETWSRFENYSVGDKVIYRGNLYERDFTRWNFIQACP